MNREAFINAVREAGIVGQGGAGFPAHVKYAAEADTVIANGCECEPLLHTDHHIMSHDGAAVLRGLVALKRATGASRGVLAIKRKHTDLVPALQQQAAALGLEVFLLDDFYPAGDEQILVREVTGRSVPPLGIPLAVGTVVANVGTLADVDGALGSQGPAQPVLDKTLTVTGDVARPCVLKAPLGTSLKECLEAAGGATVAEPVFILGGPMMGRVVDSEGLAQEVVSKTTGGLIVLPAGHPLHRNACADPRHMRRRAASACIQCRACSDLCPRRLIGHPLETHRIMRAFSSGQEGEAALAALCCECGACEHYACPMGMSPRRINQYVKSVLQEQGTAYAGSREILEEATIWREYRRIPTKRLAARLGIARYLALETPYIGQLSPSMVRIPLRQHIGAPAVACVAEGSQVRAGDCIGDIPADALGAKIHASISGNVYREGNFIRISAS